MGWMDTDERQRWGDWTRMRIKTGISSQNAAVFQPWSAEVEQQTDIDAGCLEIIQ